MLWKHFSRKLYLPLIELLVNPKLFQYFRGFNWCNQRFPYNFLRNQGVFFLHIFHIIIKKLPILAGWTKESKVCNFWMKSAERCSWGMNKFGSGCLFWERLNLWCIFAYKWEFVWSCLVMVNCKFVFVILIECYQIVRLSLCYFRKNIWLWNARVDRFFGWNWRLECVYWFRFPIILVITFMLYFWIVLILSVLWFDLHHVFAFIDYRVDWNLS